MYFRKSFKMSTPAANNIAFLAVNSSQKNCYNFKELTKSMNEMVLSASSSIVKLNSEDMTEEKVQSVILEAINSVYYKPEEVSGKKKVKRDKKQALTSYIIYCNAFRSKVKEENPEMDPKDVTRTLAEMWNKLSENEKKPYVEESKRQAELIKEADDTSSSSSTKSEKEEKKPKSNSTKGKKSETKEEKTTSSSTKSEKEDKKTKSSSNKGKKSEVKVPAIEMDDDEPLLDPKPTTTKKSKK